MQNSIEISLKKGKSILLFLGCIVFVIASLFIFNLKGADASPFLGKGIGAIGFAFFGVAGLFFLKKLTDKKPGLTINHKGIIENTNGLSTRVVEWNDITGFKVLDVSGQRLILVMVKKSQKYIDKASNNAQKRLLRLNDKEYGTPISITTNSLQMEFDELLALLNGELGKRKKKK